MFNKETSEEPAPVEEVATEAPSPEAGQKSAPGSVGTSMMMIGVIPLVLMLVAVVVSNLIVGIVLFIVAAIGFFFMWKKAQSALSGSLIALRDEAFAVANEDLPSLGQAISSGTAISDLGTNRQPVEFEDSEFASVASGLRAVRTSAAGIGDDVSELQTGISNTFVNLARRNQALVDRQLEAIDTLEAEERDSDRLSLLYRVDHLATRMHRNAESLLVLADAKTPERHSPAVPLREVLRVAIGEVEDYKRIVPISLDETNVAGPKASEMAHLLAELMENAAQHSPPGTAVDVTGAANPATGDYTITILDHGTGIAPEQMNSLNEMLAKPPVSTLTISHSIGLQVVSRISHKLGVQVRLAQGDGNGTVATVVVPAAVVQSWSQTVPGAAPAPAPAPAPVEAAAPAPIEAVETAPAAVEISEPVQIEAQAPIDASAPVADASAIGTPPVAAEAPAPFPTIADTPPRDPAMPLESVLDPADDSDLGVSLPKPVNEAPAAPEVFTPGNSSFEMPSDPVAPAPIAPAPAPIAPAPVASAAAAPVAAAPVASAAAAAAPVATAAAVAAAPVATAAAAPTAPAPVAAAPVAAAPVAAAPVAPAPATQSAASGGKLKKRTRSAAPAADAPILNMDEERAGPSQRSPDQVKSMLSRDKSGLERGRGPAETDGES